MVVMTRYWTTTLAVTIVTMVMCRHVSHLIRSHLTDVSIGFTDLFPPFTTNRFTTNRQHQQTTPRPLRRRSRSHLLLLALRRLLRHLHVERNARVQIGRYFFLCCVCC